ncbi:MAG: trypsin-like serine protease [Gaiellaceae bacterium]
MLSRVWTPAAVAAVAAVAALAVSVPALAITGGSVDGGGHPAVGLLIANNGQELAPECSGTLISSTVFVTAAHCTGILASNRVEVSFASQYGDGSAAIGGTAHTDPDWNPGAKDTHDLAVVVLDQSPDGVTPMALPQASSLDTVDHRTSFTNVGYGYFDRSFTFDGTRRVSSSTLTNVTPTELRLSNTSGGVCFGDSGGPRLLGDVVEAVTSTGNRNCTGQTLSYRLDTASARDFLGHYLNLP